jgi:hypothetical protein
MEGNAGPAKTALEMGKKGSDAELKLGPTGHDTAIGSVNEV